MARGGSEEQEESEGNMPGRMKNRGEIGRASSELIARLAGIYGKEDKPPAKDIGVLPKMRSGMNRKKELIKQASVAFPQLLIRSEPTDSQNTGGYTIKSPFDPKRAEKVHNRRGRKSVFRK